MNLYGQNLKFKFEMIDFFLNGLIPQKSQRFFCNRYFMTLYCGGFNASNQLGCISDKNLPYKMDVPVDGLRCLTNGEDHSILVYNNGSVYAVGDDEDFTIGTPNRTLYLSPEKIDSIISKEKIIYAHSGSFYSSYLTESGKIIICSLKQKENPITFAPENPIIHLSGCGRSPVAIDSKGNAYIFKDDPSIEPEYISYFDKPIYDICQTDAFTACIDIDGCALGNGILNNGNHEFVKIEALKNKKIKQISACEIHAIFVTDDNNAFIFSDIYNEEMDDIGFHDLVDVFCDSIEDDDPNKDILKDNLIKTFRNNIAQVATGCTHALILTCDQKLFCYGYNNDGALLIDKESCADLPKEIKIEGQISSILCGPLQSFVLVNHEPLAHAGAIHFNICK